MLCREITAKIEETFPKTAACSWDNVGLLAGRKEKEVKRLYLALDATDEVIEHAAAWKADLLVTHHPLLFSSIKRITDDDFIGRRLLRLIREDISYYAMHTNYDVMRMGEAAAERLLLTDTEPLEVTLQMEEKASVKEKGIGCIGMLPERMSLERCAAQVKKIFALPDVRSFGDRQKQIKKVAVVPGSGKDEISEAVEKGADVLITGDIGHHDGIDAVARGLAVIDAGHYGLEHIFMDEMEQFFKRNWSEFEIMKEPITHPFWSL